KTLLNWEGRELLLSHKYSISIRKKSPLLSVPFKQGAMPLVGSFQVRKTVAKLIRLFVDGLKELAPCLKNPSPSLTTMIQKSFLTSSRNNPISTQQLCSHLLIF